MSWRTYGNHYADQVNLRQAEVFRCEKFPVMLHWLANGGQIMEWFQILTIVGANFAMILWCMRERRSDFLHIMRLIEEVKNEMKDFHGRLCALEAKGKK